MGKAAGARLGMDSRQDALCPDQGQRWHGLCRLLPRGFWDEARTLFVLSGPLVGGVRWGPGSMGWGEAGAARNSLPQKCYFSGGLWGLTTHRHGQPQTQRGQLCVPFGSLRLD